MVARWSTESRPTFVCYLHARHPLANRPTIARRSVDATLSKNCQQMVAEYRPMIARLSADHKHWFVLYCLQCIFIHNIYGYQSDSCIFFFGLEAFSGPLLRILSGFCVGLLIELMAFWNVDNFLIQCIWTLLMLDCKMWRKMNWNSDNMYMKKITSK